MPRELAATPPGPSWSTVAGRVKYVDLDLMAPWRAEE
jgi:hypothetical protein